MTLEKFEELDDMVQHMQRLQRLSDEVGNTTDFCELAKHVLAVDTTLRHAFIALVESQLNEVEEAFRNA